MEKDTVRHLIRDASKHKTLDLSFCNLHEIPAEVFRISGLKRLLLNNNKLTVLPDDLARLDALEYLDLSNNQIKHLPASLAAFTDSMHQPSRTINVACNNLSSIANELYLFFGRHRLIITGNPALTISEETRDPSKTALIVPMETQRSVFISRVLEQKLASQIQKEESEKESRSESRDARIKANQLKRMIRSEKERNRSSGKRADRILKDI